MLILLLVSVSRASAEESLNDDWRGDTADTRPSTDNAGPIYSAGDHWVGPAVIIMLGLFLAAAVAGPIVRAEIPDAVPPSISHEEDPAVDRH